METLVTLTTVRFSHEAQLIKSCLQAAGVSCFLDGESMVSCVGPVNEMTTSWSNPLGGIRIRVNVQDLGAAQGILQDAADLPDEDAPPARLPWHGIITGGLRSVPWPLRIVLIATGGPVVLFWIGLLVYALGAPVWQFVNASFINP